MYRKTKQKKVIEVWKKRNTQDDERRKKKGHALLHPSSVKCEIKGRRANREKRDSDKWERDENEDKTPIPLILFLIGIIVE